MTATMSTAISTTLSGAPVTSEAHSRSVAADGAIILTDHYLVEKSSPSSTASGCRSA